MKEIVILVVVLVFLGIIELVIFGVNLKFGKLFIVVVIGGVIGGVYVVWM